MELLQKNDVARFDDDDVEEDEAPKKSKYEKIYDLMLRTPICYISGKFFDTKTKKEIKQWEKGIQQLAIRNFRFPLKEAELKYAVECIRIKEESNDKGVWPTLALWEKAKTMYLENPLPRHPLAFELTVEQYMIIYFLVYKQDDEIMFITTGRGKTGKSTFLNIIRQIFDNDFSSATLSDVTTNEFARATAIQHRLICSDEINADDVDAGILKTLISRQPTLLNAKNQKPVEIKSQSCLFYCCNKEPRIDITDTGIMRRIKFYRRDKVITSPNRKLKTKEYTKDELLDFLIAAQSVYDKFEALEEDPLSLFDIDTGHYLFQNNSVFRFYFRCNRKVYHIETSEQLEREYYLYREWCQGSGYRPYNEANFELVHEELEKALEKQTMANIAKKYED